MKIGPVLYDFVRGILRSSMIIVLAIFILLGIASSYLIADTVRRQGASYLAYYIPIVFEVDMTTGSLRIEGYAIHPYGGDLEGVFKYNLTCESTPAGFKTAKIRGKFAINDTVNLSEYMKGSCVPRLWVEVETPLGKYTDVIIPANLDVETTTYFGSNNVEHSRIYYEVDNKTRLVVVMAKGFYTRGNESDVTLIVTVLPLSDRALWETPLEVYVGNMGASFTPRDSPTNEGWRFVARVSPGINIIQITPEFGVNTTMLQILVRLPANTSSSALIVIRPAPALTEDIVKSTTFIVASSVGQGVFTAFFPILVLYLVYVFVAKPRSQGALEFILARPITRLDLFVTRLSASMLVVASAVTLFYAVTLLALQLFIGIPLNPKPILILYLGALTSMLAFLSLCYLVASWVSGGNYLGLTIFLYVFYRMLYSNVVPVVVIWVSHGSLSYVTADEIVRTQYLLNYFNPFGVESYALYFAQRELFGSVPLYNQVGLPDVGDIVNPYMVVAAYMSWIVLPLIAGWAIFRRANLIR